MTVIVTGASRGIGRAVAERLHKSGYKVIGLYKKSALDTKYLIPEFEMEQADVSDINSLKIIYKKIKDKKVQGIVNCAGVFETMPIEIFPHKLYKDIIDVNLVGTINVCSTFINLMDKDVHSPIINISSIAAHIPNLNTIYTASKYGVEGFTSSLSKELSNTKIRVNAICPGLIETDMTRNTIPDDSLWDKYSQLQPIGIKLKPEHVADLVELLFDPRSSCVGGQSIQIG